MRETRYHGLIVRWDIQKSAFDDLVMIESWGNCINNTVNWFMSATKVNGDIACNDIAEDMTYNQSGGDVIWNYVAWSIASNYIEGTMMGNYAKWSIAWNTVRDNY